MTENGTNKSSLKVNFSLTSKKPKKKKKQQHPQNKSVSDINDAFDSGDEEDKARKLAETELENRKLEGPLIIPLIPPDKSQNDNKLKSVDEQQQEKNNTNDEDKEAILDLIQSANDHKEKRNSRVSNDDTNFSSTGSLTIVQPESNPDSNSQFLQVSKNSNKQNDKDDTDTKKYRKDLTNRAEDLSVSSLAYVHVPISEFGAAMLRGMGWKGNSTNQNKDDTGEVENSKPRHHRLGLGATPALTEKDVLEIAKKKSGRQQKQKRDAERETLLKLKRKNEAQEKKDLQKRIENGSIVWVQQSLPENEKDNMEQDKTKRRAIMIQTLGVPGLDQMLIQYENEKDHFAVSKKYIILETREALQKNPFRKFVDESVKQEKGKNDSIDTKENLASSSNSNRTLHQRNNEIDSDIERKTNKHDEYYSRSYDRKYDKRYDHSRRDHRRSRSYSRSRSRSVSLDKRDIDYKVKRKRTYDDYDDDRRKRYDNERGKYSSSDKDRKRERKRHRSRKRDRESDHTRSRDKGRRTDNRERRRSKKYKDDDHDHKADRNRDERRYRDRSK